MNLDRILCCVDFSSNADKAFNAALDLSQKYGSELHLLHVLPPAISPLITDVDLLVPSSTDSRMKDRLKDQVETHYVRRIPDTVTAVVTVSEGHVSSTILAYLETHEIDQVVLGAYGLSGVELVLFGSVAKRVAHKAPCTVMIVR